MPAGTKPTVKQPIGLNLMSPTIPSNDISMGGRMGGYENICNPSVPNVTHSVTSNTSTLVNLYAYFCELRKVYEFFFGDNVLH